MFDELQRALRRIEGQKVSLAIPSDSEAYFDRECPSEKCLFQFKVHEQDWREKVRDEEVFCPFCGHTAESSKWWTQEQIEHAKSAAFAEISGQINTAMKRDADSWNRRQPRNSNIRMTMNVDSRPQQVSLPPAAAEPMQLKISCPACSCRYAVIGAAFFCPGCGHNAAEQMFDLSLTGIAGAVDATQAIRRAIADRDTAETTVRLIVENALQNAVTAFQRFAESLYARFAGVPCARRNVFQNLDEGSALWRAATGKHYDDYLSSTEGEILTRAFQQRHLLAHTQGMVDEDYIKRSGDQSYRVGQRLVVKDSTVREALPLVRKLALAMAADVQLSLP
jgi:hypothetical protein